MLRVKQIRVYATVTNGDTIFPAGIGFKLLSQRETDEELPVKTKKNESIRMMPADVARCLGSKGGKGQQMVCPQREQCLRHLSPPQPYPNQVYMMPPADMASCEEFMEV